MPSSHRESASLSIEAAISWASGLIALLCTLFFASSMFFAATDNLLNVLIMGISLFEVVAFIYLISAATAIALGLIARKQAILQSFSITSQFMWQAGLSIGLITLGLFVVTLAYMLIDSLLWLYL